MLPNPCILYATQKLARPRVSLTFHRSLSLPLSRFSRSLWAVASRLRAANERHAEPQPAIRSRDVRCDSGTLARTREQRPRLARSHAVVACRIHRGGVKLARVKRDARTTTSICGNGLRGKRHSAAVLPPNSVIAASSIHIHARAKRSLGGHCTTMCGRYNRMQQLSFVCVGVRA